MILGSIGRGVEKQDGERKEAKIMCIMEQIATVGGWGQFHWENLGDTMENISKLFSPSSPCFSAPRARKMENLSFNSHLSLTEGSSPGALISWHLWPIAHNKEIPQVKS